MMTEIEAVKVRHSVRNYLDKKIEAETVSKLQEMIKSCNEEGALHFVFCEDAGNTYNRLLNRAMGLGSAPSVIACMGPDDASVAERVGYYGERIVLYAQQLGLNTCWAGTYNKANLPVKPDKGEKLVITIAIGYGENQGRERKTKNFMDVASGRNEYPDWFKTGVEYALMAPTAINQQKFEIRLNEDDSVSFIDKGGVLSSVDIGIVRYHFELSKI